MPPLTAPLILSLLFAGPAAVAASQAAPATPPGVTATGPATGQAPAMRLPRIALHGDALSGQPRSLAVDELEKLAALVEWTIRDPYRNHTNRYSGIPLRDLVKKLAPGAQRVRMRAVNDYIAWFDRREWETLPIMLATRDNGARMTVANKGPARIIYLQDADNELQMQVHAPKWIWQVVDVEFHAR